MLDAGVFQLFVQIITGSRRLCGITGNFLMQRQLLLLFKPVFHRLFYQLGGRLALAFRLRSETTVDNGWQRDMEIMCSSGFHGMTPATYFMSYCHDMQDIKQKGISNTSNTVRSRITHRRGALHYYEIMENGELTLCSIPAINVWS